ncbi:cysteine hydrolase family protein [Lentibacillus saliphilus]|uniref:cysteine hydrolase family protein n=1 Tax=Lentibacillus saliphilus TaxID=2737028 RepID=UPI001C302C7A|nr:isochorismatase family cysteine hydrolase [Lentibacillus saliphilus]
MLEFDTRDKTAILLIDMQNDAVKPNGILPAEDALEIIEPIDHLLQLARQHTLPIIYTQHIHRNDLSDFGIARYFEPPSCLEDGLGKNIIDELTPQESDIVLLKRRYDAFIGTELDLILRQKNIKNLIVAGVLTDGCVLGTVAHARGLDYKVCLLEDCTRGTTIEKHRAALKVLETYCAKVTTLENAKQIFDMT